MTSFWGNNIRLQIFGESHGPAIGAVLEGLPVNFHIDTERLAAFMRRRSPGRSQLASQRKESDSVEFLSGLYDGHTTGAPLAFIIRNEDAHSSDYKEIFDIPRPGHADFTANARYQGAQDPRSGGHLSGRLTAPLCAAGAIAMQILEERQIYVGAHIASIGSIRDYEYPTTHLSKDTLTAEAEFPVLNPDSAEEMQAAISDAKQNGDSIGGRIEAAAIGLPPGLGDPIFGGMENSIASIMFGIPAVRGIEFGDGMVAAEMSGSEHNDEFVMDGQNIRTASNHCGGILGGITTGMPLIVRVAIKPTPSIQREQNTVNMKTGEDVLISVPGRHDPCIVPRAVPAVQAALALAILDKII